MDDGGDQSRCRFCGCDHCFEARVDRSPTLAGLVVDVGGNLKWGCEDFVKVKRNWRIHEFLANSCDRHDVIQFGS